MKAALIGLLLVLRPFGTSAQVPWYNPSFDIDEGVRHMAEGDYRTAQMYLLRPLDTLRIYGPATEEYRNYYNLHLLYDHLQQGDQMLRFARMAHEMGDKLPVSKQAESYALLVEAYAVLGQFEEGEAVGKEWFDFLSANKDQLRSIDYFTYHDFMGSLYEYARKYEQALSHLFAAKAISRDGSIAELTYQETLADIGWVYMYMGRHADALPYLRNYLDYSESISDTSYIEDDLILLGQAYEYTGDTAAALHYMKRGYQMQLAQIRNETATVSDGLALRDEIGDQYELIDEQQGQIDRQRRLQIAGAIIGFLLLVGLLGLYFGLRNNRRKNAMLAATNAQNETLLKEIHHRVKNNLEVVSSLLELQSATLTDGDARDAMLAGQSRVASMSLLHQKLYQGDDLAMVNMANYLRELTQGIQETYGLDQRIELQVAIDAELELDVDQAVPVGLIVNELVTNSLKYAFGADREAGRITVAMHRRDNKTVLLVSDDGRGKSGTENQGTGFGTRLVGLLTRQLDGALREESKAGLKTEVVF